MRDELFPVALFCCKSDHFELRRKTLRSLIIVSTQAPKSAPRTSSYPTPRLNSVCALLLFWRDTELWLLDRGELAGRNVGEVLPCRLCRQLDTVVRCLL